MPVGAAFGLGWSLHESVKLCLENKAQLRGMKRRAELVQEFFSLGEWQVEEAAQKLEAGGDPE